MQADIFFGDDKKPNHYNTLGIKVTAAEDEIKKAYRALAKQYHPDKNPNNPAAEAKFKEVQTAYEVLNNPAKKAAYDRTLSFNDRLDQASGTGKHAYDSNRRASGDFNNAAMKIVNISEMDRHMAAYVNENFSMLNKAKFSHADSHYVYFGGHIPPQEYLNDIGRLAKMSGMTPADANGIWRTTTGGKTDIFMAKGVYDFLWAIEEQLMPTVTIAESFIRASNSYKEQMARAYETSMKACKDYSPAIRKSMKF